jgi:2-polyprenyl-6-methoxyphenol hydroxylase-like FAD-dependent oxidoreductase
METVTRRIAIAGGGPAGLVAAIACRQAGFDVTVFEQAASFEHVGGAIGIQGNGLRVLSALGLFERFQPHIELLMRAGLESPPGRSLVMADFSEIDVTSRGFAVALRYDLQDVLLQSAREHDVRIHFNTRVASVQRSGDDVVLSFRDGGSERAEVVIACDGARSAIRDTGGFVVNRREVGEAYLRCVAAIAHPRPERVGEYWHPDSRRAGAFPLPGNRTYLFCSVPIGKWKHILESDLDAWIRSWDDFGEPVASLVRAVDWTRAVYDELSDVRVDRWHRDRVILAGDAAHAMTPNLGQGANSAMVDALVLVNLLVAMNGDIDAAAARYEQIRKPFVTRIQDAAWYGGRFASLKSPMLRALRDTAIRLSNVIGPARRASMLLTAGYNPAEQEYLRPVRPSFR